MVLTVYEVNEIMLILEPRCYLIRIKSWVSAKESIHIIEDPPVEFYGINFVWSAVSILLIHPSQHDDLQHTYCYTLELIINILSEP
jgi:hypothetical protein